MSNDPIPEVDERYNTTVQEYVEIIRDIVQMHSVARVKDIAEQRGVTRSSVSTVLNVLRDLELIEHEHYGYVQLTKNGKKLGEILTRRHTVIRNFLTICLKLNPGLADKEACRLEHTMSSMTLNALVRFVYEECIE
ncbi:MAG: metal-dependent transcriptional regulator [Candidatus Hatepunaea meridiana]|nr:metal-dependent transcriptional regulator [Candidatus Hatepunaea meridiana]